MINKSASILRQEPKTEGSPAGSPAQPPQGSPLSAKSVSLSFALSPHGKLYLESSGSNLATLNSDTALRLEEAFHAGSPQGPPGVQRVPDLRAGAQGLLHLAAFELRTELPPVFVYWRNFARLFMTQLCSIPDLQDTPEKLRVEPPSAELERFLSSAPAMTGGEYITPDSLMSLWLEMESALREDLKRFQGGLKAYLEEKYPLWNLVGRVYLHLAENKTSPETPFAFLATYTTRLSNQAKVQHLPLGRAIEEYSGQENKARLLALLLPLHKAAQTSAFLKDLVDSGQIFHSLAWTPQEAYAFLKDTPAFEASGLAVRVPDWWKARRPPRPQVNVTIGNKKTSSLGMDAMLDFSIKLTLDGETISQEEWNQILKKADGLVFFKGRWVEINREKLTEVLEHWKSVQKTAAHDGISFIEGMRLLAGAAVDGELMPQIVTAREWSGVTAGQWLSQALEGMASPDRVKALDLDGELKTVLRPYQKVGLQWLWHLYSLGLGACLADDMGLGKTIQVLALMLLIKKESKDGRKHEPSLLVVPASLIANWKAEIDRFAPTLKALIAHPSTLSSAELSKLSPRSFAGFDLVITTYGSLLRLAWIKEVVWGLVVLDEAQAIKNPQAKQTRAVKDLNSKNRLVLTGTPVENSLLDLWSLFDFIGPGLLGSLKVFSRFSKQLANNTENSYGPLRNLVRPYILRRLKSDKNIIADLPDKTELRAFCGLSKTQAALYQQAVSALSEQIESADGIKRRGIILAFLMRLKQICNHPSQWLGDQDYSPGDSGKFLRLKELCEMIALKQEKVLVFTQFCQITDALGAFLAGIFGRSGLILTGETPVAQRKQMVDSFQDDLGPPFFVLSLKAGGTGLNLTAASHVIHFDRWWNPAVEDQATDRAYRIGQRKNVLVHKFICRGTIEEKIDKLIESKIAMSREILAGSADKLITEMGNEELLKLVSLDIHSALEIT